MSRRERSQTPVCHENKVSVPTLACAAGVLIFMLGLFLILVSPPADNLSHGIPPSLVPWHSVGGCGASAAGGSGASYQWIGKGVSGSIIDLEARLSSSRQTATGWGMGILNTTSIPLTLTYTAKRRVFKTLSLAMPFLWKEKDQSKTGGIGDMSLTMTKRLGANGQIGTSLGITLPTGKSDVHDATHKLTESVLQLGSGLFGFSLTIDYTIDRDWGLMIAGASYAGGLLKMETVERQWDEDLHRGTPSKRTLSWARVSGETYISDEGYDDAYNRIYEELDVGIGAENDWGVMTPDNIGLFFYVGRSRNKLMPSAALAASIPLGHSRVKDIIPQLGTIQLDAGQYPNADAVLAHIVSDYTVIDSAARDGGAQFFISGKSPADATGTTWIYGKSTYQRKKNWVVVTPGLGMEFQTNVFPVFFSFTLPFEFNMDDGVGLNGFAFDIGMKLRLF